MSRPVSTLSRVDLDHAAASSCRESLRSGSGLVAMLGLVARVGAGVNAGAALRLADASASRLQFAIRRAPAIDRATRTACPRHRRSIVMTGVLLLGLPALVVVGCLFWVLSFANTQAEVDAQRWKEQGHK
jgi:hypothetical protein